MLQNFISIIAHLTLKALCLEGDDSPNLETYPMVDITFGIETPELYDFAPDALGMNVGEGHLGWDFFQVTWVGTPNLAA